MSRLAQGWLVIRLIRDFIMKNIANPKSEKWIIDKDCITCKYRYSARCTLSENKDAL